VEVSLLEPVGAVVRGAHLQRIPGAGAVFV